MEKENLHQDLESALCCVFNSCIDTVVLRMTGDSIKEVSRCAFRFEGASFVTRWYWRRRLGRALDKMSRVADLCAEIIKMKDSVVSDKKEGGDE